MSKFECKLVHMDNTITKKIVEAKDKIDAFMQIKYHIESEKLAIKKLEIRSA